MYSRAARVAQAAVTVTGKERINWDLLADRLLTSKWLGFPLMFAMLGVILWMTIAGANVPERLTLRLPGRVGSRSTAGMRSTRSVRHGG